MTRRRRARSTLLLPGALAGARSKPRAPVLLLATRAWTTGMMSGSFRHQIEDTLRGVDREPNHAAVAGFKSAPWGTCVVALVCSCRRLLAVCKEVDA